MGKKRVHNMFRFDLGMHSENEIYRAWAAHTISSPPRPHLPSYIHLLIPSTVGEFLHYLRPFAKIINHRWHVRDKAYHLAWRFVRLGTTMCKLEITTCIYMCVKRPLSNMYIELRSFSSFLAKMCYALYSDICKHVSVKATQATHKANCARHWSHNHVHIRSFVLLS